MTIRGLAVAAGRPDVQLAAPASSAGAGQSEANVDHRETDIIVAGAGASGLVAAIALARAGYDVVCAGPADTRPNGRTVALFEGSLRFLQAIGVRARVDAAAQRIRAIRIVDDTGTRWPVPPLMLEAGDIGLDALGSNIETDRLVSGLLAAAEDLPGLHLTGCLLESIGFEETRVRARDAEGRGYSARLLVAADGRKSPARAAAGIAAQSWTYPQVALTGLLRHEKPHDGMSVEYHTRGGPCTLVPLGGTPDHPHRSSLVWLMTPREAEARRALDDDALAAELQRKTRSVVGAVSFEAARGSFPMGGLKVNRLCGHRTVLIGEAAHAFPPLGAQGLNLSLRDAAQLLVTLGRRAAEGDDIGRIERLKPYERARRRDVAMRTNGVDVLNRSIMTDFGPVDLARGLGAVMLRAVPPLRRALLREGILPQGPVVDALMQR